MLTLEQAQGIASSECSETMVMRYMSRAAARAPAGHQVVSNMVEIGCARDRNKVLKNLQQIDEAELRDVVRGLKAARS